MQENIYDNSNIAESYAGATTPLTFSFVRYIYQEAYQCFSRMMGVSDKEIKNNKDIFEHMVEYIGYRIYYNLTSWYEMLSFFPGHRLSSEFMEKMMGAEKHNLVREIHHDAFKKYFFYFPKTLLHIIWIFFVFLFLGRRMKKFNIYFDNVFFKINSINLHTLTLAELKNTYKELDAKLLSQWRVPIANDFAVMVSAGLADKLFKKWLDSDDAYSYMRPTANKPLISLDPGNKIMDIITIISADKIIRDLFLGAHTEEEIMRSLHAAFPTHRVTHEIDAYLREFGTRMPNELKLESETLTENPKNLITLIKTIMQGELIPEKSSQDKFINSDSINLGLFKRVFLRLLLRWAGNSICRREEARFRRALIFGQVRKIFLAIGGKLQQRQCIKNKRDVFYLSVEELFNFIGGDKDFELQDAVEQRKQLFIKWKNVELPRRFETAKSIHEIEQEVLRHPDPIDKKPVGTLVGSVASRPNNMHTFSGTAVTLKDFDPSVSFEGKILVTCQTDPGWTFIFPLLKGIIVERGGMLSHAAIVARELHIPCIVGVQHATDCIPNGTQITLDLENGFIT